MTFRFWCILVLVALVSWKSIPSSTDSHNQSPSTVSLSLERLNKVLYIGLDNPFVLNLCGISHDNVIVTIDNGGSIESNEGNYIARVNQKGQVTITINHKKGSKKEIGKFVFRAEPIPDPVIKLGSYSPGPIPLKSFKVQRLIIAQLEGLGFDLPIKIASFEFVLISEGHPPVTHKVQGAAFPPTILEAIKSLKVGDYIILDAIKIDVQEGRILPAVVYRLI